MLSVQVCAMLMKADKQWMTYCKDSLYLDICISNVNNVYSWISLSFVNVY